MYCYAISCVGAIRYIRRAGNAAATRIVKRGRPAGGTANAFDTPCTDGRESGGALRVLLTTYLLFLAFFFSILEGRAPWCSQSSLLSVLYPPTPFCLSRRAQPYSFRSSPFIAKSSCHTHFARVTATLTTIIINSSHPPDLSDLQS